MLDGLDVELLDVLLDDEVLDGLDVLLLLVLDELDVLELLVLELDDVLDELLVDELLVEELEDVLLDDVELDEDVLLGLLALEISSPPPNSTGTLTCIRDRMNGSKVSSAISPGEIARL